MLTNRGTVPILSMCLNWASPIITISIGEAYFSVTPCWHKYIFGLRMRIYPRQSKCKYLVCLWVFTSNLILISDTSQNLNCFRITCVMSLFWCLALINYHIFNVISSEPAILKRCISANAIRISTRMSLIWAFWHTLNWSWCKEFSFRID